MGIPPGQKRAYSHGETVKVVLRVRNVSKDTVPFEYVYAFLVENPPAVTDADGKLIPAKRRILEIECLNCVLDDVTLVPTMRKPFDVLAEGLVSENSREDTTSFELFLRPFSAWKQTDWQLAESCNS